MDEKSMNSDTLNVKISDEVVAIISAKAAGEIKGVYSLGTAATTWTEKLGAKKQGSRGVKVEIKENDCFIDLHVTVEYGSRIPEVAWEIQESVKKEVETLTGLNVVKVNIHVDGVYIPKEDAPIKSQIVSDETADEE